MPKGPCKGGRSHQQTPRLQQGAAYGGQYTAGTVSEHALAMHVSVMKHVHCFCRLCHDCWHAMLGGKKDCYYWVLADTMARCVRQQTCYPYVIGCFDCTS